MYDWYDGNNVKATRYYPIIPIDEIWIPISTKLNKNIKSYYYISNFGRVASNKYGDMRLLKPFLSKGYNRITFSIYIENENQYPSMHFNIHRAVLISFSELNNNLPDNFMNLEVNHKDTITTHNWLWNLEWNTSYENIHHAIDYGYMNNSGEGNGRSKLLEKDIYEIFDLYNMGYSYAYIANLYDVSTGTICRIITGDGWNNINITRKEKNVYTPFTNEEINNISIYD